MISSTLGWRAGRAGVLLPVVESTDALPRTIHHGDAVIVFGARSDLRGVVDLTQSVSGGALAVLTSIMARGGQVQQIALFGVYSARTPRSGVRHG